VLLKKYYFTFTSGIPIPSSRVAETTMAGVPVAVAVAALVTLYSCNELNKMAESTYTANTMDMTMANVCDDSFSLAFVQVPKTSMQHPGCLLNKRHAEYNVM
jgi:hypothetical protein